jgi:hypothetical protein
MLKKIIRERRKMSKEERLKLFRNDSVDEVDTTDLENWELRTRHMTFKTEDFSDHSSGHELDDP